LGRFVQKRSFERRVPSCVYRLKYYRRGPTTLSDTMTDLNIPQDADAEQAKALVREHFEIGDVVEVRDAERTEDHQMDTSGEITGFEPDYLEIDDQPLGEGSARYEEIQSVAKIESE